MNITPMKVRRTDFVLFVPKMIEKELATTPTTKIRMRHYVARREALLRKEGPLPWIEPRTETQIPYTCNTGRHYSLHETCHASTLT